MILDLADFVKKSTGTKRSTVLLPEITPPTTLDKELLTINLELVRFWSQRVKIDLLPVYGLALNNLVTDSSPQDIESTLTSLLETANRLVAGFNPRIRAWAVRIEEWHRRRFTGNILSFLGVDIAAFITAEQVQARIDAVVTQNASLCRGLNEDLAKRVSQTTWNGYRAQTSRRKIAKELTEALSIGKPRARLIARDQTTKLAGELDQARQTSLGIKKYEWKHSRKANPRASHVARDGKIFSWDKPPEDGHPGFAINCGCKAKAFLEF